MNFNLNLSAKKINATSPFKKTLAPWNIYKAKLTGIRLTDFDGKMSDGSPAKKYIINFDFEGYNPEDKTDDGVFTAGLFVPMEEADGVRQQRSNGKDNPSSAEQFMFNLVHIGQKLDPKKFEKFMELEFNLPSDIEKMVEYLKQVFADVIKKGNYTNLKLISNKKGRTQTPYCVSIRNEDGEAFFSNDWLGDEVYWSSYELEQMKAFKAGGPTDMGATSMDALPGGVNLSDDVKGGLADQIDDLPFKL